MKPKNKLQSFWHYPLVLLTSLQLSCGSSKYSDIYKDIYEPQVTQNFKAVYLKEINVDKKSDSDFTFKARFNYDLYKVTYKPYRTYTTNTETYSRTKYSLVDFKLLKKKNKLDESGKTVELRPFNLTYDDGSDSFRTYSINQDGSLTFKLKVRNSYETINVLKIERKKGYRYGSMDTTTIIPNDSYVINPASYRETKGDKGEPIMSSAMSVFLSFYETNSIFVDLDHGGNYRSSVYREYMAILANYTGVEIHTPTKKSAKKIAIEHKFEDDQRKKKIEEDNKRIEAAKVEAQKIKETQRLEDIVNKINSNFGSFSVTLLDATDGTKIQGAEIKISSYAQSPDDLLSNYGVSLSLVNGLGVITSYPYGKNDESHGNVGICETNRSGRCNFKVFKNTKHFMTITKEGYQQLVVDEEFMPKKDRYALEIRLPKSGIPVDLMFNLKSLFGGSGLEIEEK